MIESIMPWVGLASFALSACAWMMRKIAWLRLTAICSGVLGITYNSYLAMHADPATAFELKKIVGWLVLFFLINCYQSIQLLLANIEVRLSENDRIIGTGAFPQMRSRDLSVFLGLADSIHLDSGVTLVELGANTDSLFCLISGNLFEHPVDGATRRLPNFALLGDATWVVNEQYAGSPSKIITSGPTFLLKWEYSKLRNVCATNATMAAAITDGVVRGMIKKRHFLKMAEIPMDESMLSPAEMRLHASTFPELKTGAFCFLMSKATTMSFNEGELIDNDGKIMAINHGSVRVERTDGHYLDLTVGRLIGDLALCRETTANVTQCWIRANSKTEFFSWNIDEINLLAEYSPHIYLGFLRSIQREVTYKLKLPMEFQQKIPLHHVSSKFLDA